MIDYISYHHEQYPDVLVLESGGRLDSDSSQFLLDCIQGFIERGDEKIVVDCSELEYISSIGLGALVRANARIKKRGGAITVAGARGIVADALSLVHFDRVLGLFPTVHEAAASIG